MDRILSQTNRTKLITLPKRGSYSSDTIYSIIDDTFICHIGFYDGEQTYVIPVVYGRKNNKIYFHGGKGRRLFKTLKQEIEICITITILDGIVLAKSAFHHSVNYRSVVIFGKPKEIQTSKLKLEALEIITDHLLDGRWMDSRLPNDKELNVVSVFSINLDEASAKIRTGPPTEEKEDNDLNYWSGIIPFSVKPGNPIPADLYSKNLPIPEYINSYINR